MGYTLIDGRPVFMLPYGIKVPEVAIQGLAEHNVREYTNLRNLLPGIYANWEGASRNRQGIRQARGSHSWPTAPDAHS